MARILIVDDSNVERTILRNIALSLGHTVVGEACDGEGACETYARLRPDIVTMDLTMKGSDGAEAIEKIMADYPAARIIVVSASQDRQVILSALGKGACHFLIKPVSQEKVETVVNQILLQTTENHRPTDAETKVSAKVLIVDDSAVARKSLAKIVTTLGHVVVGEAVNGAQAFLEYTKLKPDIVTMDLTMQGMGGAEATSKIIAVYPEARIIVISAMEERQVVLDALERGARHFVIKPINQDKVMAVINNVMAQNIDLQKHRELVRRMKRPTDGNSLIDNGVSKFVPPYIISVQECNFVHVVINESLTLTSFKSLLLELGEYLKEGTRVLFDFGPLSRFDKELLEKIDKLFMDIEANAGMVKAISNNQHFIELVSQATLDQTVGLLAEKLRYVERWG